MLTPTANPQPCTPALHAALPISASGPCGGPVDQGDAQPGADQDPGQSAVVDHLHAGRLELPACLLGPVVVVKIEGARRQAGAGGGIVQLLQGGDRKSVVWGRG